MIYLPIGGAMKPKKAVLTTGEVARICNVAPRTVSKWFDQGHLRGYRIPGSKDRRIPVDQLIRFMRSNGIPLNGLDVDETRVLVLSGDEGWANTLASALEQGGGFKVTVTATGVRGGRGGVPAQAQRDRDRRHTPRRAARSDRPVFFRGTAELATTRLIGVAPGLDDGGGEALLQTGLPRLPGANRSKPAHSWTQ